MLISSFAWNGLDDLDLDGLEPAMPYPQLAGKRVLITGVSSLGGVDIVRAFAEHKTELVIDMAERSEAMQAVAELAAQSALDLTIFDAPLKSEQDILAMARKAIAKNGGVDLVVNLVPLLPPRPDAAAGMAAIEAHISALFLKACLVGRVAANRMRLTQTEGVVLNVAVPLRGAGQHRGFLALARATLSSLTMGEAQTWAKDGIRFNAVAPADDAARGFQSSDLPALTGEPQMANLALFLATGRGRHLSGVTFDSALN
ncbi:MAG: hypothetical protein RL291_1233 [Pseudomonadota bacterium]|jgi:3-oxoacyl-[acyl-carrier protein] reductase